MAGFIKLFRSLAEHPLWLQERFTRAQAWVDLLMLANHHDGRILRGNLWIDVQRGQVFTSQLALAKRWHWDRKTVVRFLAALSRDGMVGTHTSNRGDTGYTIITIRNYEQYQGRNGSGRDSRTDNSVGSGRDSHAQVMPHIQEGLKKEEKERKTLSPEFKIFWAAYPKKVNEAAATRAWTRLSPTPELTKRILAAVQAQKALPEGRGRLDDGRYTPHPAKWLNNRRWKDEPSLARSPHDRINEQWAGAESGEAKL